jgi:hypothetical protein
MIVIRWCKGNATLIFNLDTKQKWSISCPRLLTSGKKVEASWNVMAHAQKPDFVFRRNGRVHLNRRGCQFSRLLAAEMWASAIVMLDTSCSEVVRGTGYPLHSPVSSSLPLPCVTVCHRISTGLYTLNWRKGGPTDGLDVLENRPICPCQGSRLRTVQPVLSQYLLARNRNTIEHHLSGRWLSGTAWPFG